MISKIHDKFITRVKSDWSDDIFSVYYNNSLKCYKIVDKEDKTYGYNWSDLDEVLSSINCRILAFE